MEEIYRMLGAAHEAELERVAGSAARHHIRRKRRSRKRTDAPSILFRGSRLELLRGRIAGLVR